MNHSEFLRKKAANLFSQTNYSYLVPYSNLFYKSDKSIAEETSPRLKLLTA